MLLKKDLSQCKDLRTVEHLAQQFGWYAAAWTPQEPHLICSDEQFTEFAKALGKLAVTQDGENLLYFLALAAETAQERKNRTDRILERKLFYETSTVITEADIARCHNDQLATPPGVRKADAMETLHFLAPPEEEKQDDAAPNGIVSISAKDLQDKEFKPIKWVVEGLLPQGLALLVAPPKYGKSWLMLWLGLQVAQGNSIWGLPTLQCDVLYLSLEDTQRRIKDRLYNLTDSAPDNLYFAVTSGLIGGGLEEQITDFLTEHSATKLVIIDTLQKVRDSKGSAGKAGMYGNDYDDISSIKRIADGFNIAILLVHHLRKLQDSDDPFNDVSGSTGIISAADTNFILRRKRSGNAATLLVSGRDVEYQELTLQFNDLVWELVERKNSEDIHKAELPKFLFRVVDFMECRTEWVGTATELLTEMKEQAQYGHKVSRPVRL